MFCSLHWYGSLLGYGHLIFLKQQICFRVYQCEKISRRGKLHAIAVYTTYKSMNIIIIIAEFICICLCNKATFFRHCINFIIMFYICIRLWWISIPSFFFSFSSLSLLWISASYTLFSTFKIHSGMYLRSSVGSPVLFR